MHVTVNPQKECRFFHMSSDIQLEVLKWLSLRTVVLFFRTCKKSALFAEENHPLWRIFCRQMKVTQVELSPKKSLKTYLSYRHYLAETIGEDLSKIIIQFPEWPYELELNQENRLINFHTLFKNHSSSLIYKKWVNASFFLLFLKDPPAALQINCQFNPDSGDKEQFYTKYKQDEENCLSIFTSDPSSYMTLSMEQDHLISYIKKQLEGL